MKRFATIVPIVIATVVVAYGTRAQPVPTPPAAKSAPATPATLEMREGFVDANGVLIYYKTMGRGQPLVILHGGPGATHEYYLPYLLPLARHNRLVFIDERGSGRSEKLEDPRNYTVDAMVEDVEAVRRALGLGRIALLGHSFGGVLAQAYALKYQANLSHLVLASTFHSTAKLNEAFRRMLQAMDPKLRKRIEKMEKAGLYGRGKPFEKNRYPTEYMTAAWGEAYFPYLYQRRPDPNFDPIQAGNIAWDVYREMWGSHGEFVGDGNLKSFEVADTLPSIKVPTLITVGDHDHCAPWLSQEMHRAIRGSQLLILPKSGHMTFVDQPEMYNRAIRNFLHASAQ
jgi:proline iminopeptidase